MEGLILLYPLKFFPVYKNYIWGGRNLEKLGKSLPDGIVAESWELSCHPDGESIIANGIYKGKSLSWFIEEHGYEAVGTSVGKPFSWKPGDRFPLLIKFIDANDKLSVQVHPDDTYASMHEDDKSGKNEMWYIIWAKPGAKLVYGLKPGTTKKMFEDAIQNENIENLLNYVEVSAGDVIYIPAGLVHAIGEGILLAEIQQNSNNTYRVYDYNRVDSTGKKRPLHINKALDVINFDATGRIYHKDDGSEINNNSDDYKISSLISNQYFTVDLVNLQGEMKEIADGSRFYSYVVIEGEGSITQSHSVIQAGSASNNDMKTNNEIEIKMGETVFIPAAMGEYTMKGNLKALKAYII